ncbi:helix-turn-helix domain-containing protein [Ferdinandcohnia sp. Marseille-Q9671]
MNSEKELLSLIKATQALTSTRNLDEVLNLLIKEVLSVFSWADASVLFLYNPHKNHLTAKSAVGFEMSYLEKVALQPNEGMSGKTFNVKQAQIFRSGTDTSRGMSDLSPKNLEYYQKALGEKHMLPTSTICAPLLTQGECYGVLTIDSFSESVQFTQESLVLLQTFANQAMIAIENATLISQNERSNHIHRELTRVYMSHHSLDEITKTLAELIHKPVGVSNEFLDLLSYTSTCVKEIADGMKGDDVWSDDILTMKPVYIDNTSYDVYFFSIKIENEISGKLIVAAEKGEVLDSLDIFAIEQATTVFALELQSLHQQISNHFIQESLIMKEILLKPDEGQVILEKNRLYRKHDQYVILTVEFEDDGPVESVKHSSKQSFSRYLHWHLSLLPYKTLVYEDLKRYSILFMIKSKLDEEEIHQQIKSFITRLADQNMVKLRAGLGRSFTELTDIHSSLNDSLKCIEYIKQIDKNNVQYATYQDLGVFRLFLNVETQELESYLHMNLKKILDYDEMNNAELAKTLEWYLAYNHNTKKTAQELFVHENTIKYRINSIKKLLEIEEITGEKGLELYIALKIRHYLDKSHLSK